MAEERRVSNSVHLAATGIGAAYGAAPVLHDVDVTIPRGRVTTIIGPNGCGKSTLLRVLARLLTPTSGTVLLDEKPITDLRARELATRLAMLPQNPVAPEGMTVADLAARGRAPHQPWYRQWSPDDDAIAADAMAATGVLDLADRPLDELSGGQRQRAWIALSLAQQTDVLLLDEPTTHLDLAHAVEVLELVTRLRDQTGRTFVLVLHDLSLAARYSDQLVVLRGGRVHTTGAPADVVTPELLRDVFGLAAHVFPDPVDGLPTVVPARATAAP
ncbi:ABC transporter ATP-binding protein [Cryptosporangium minutisporangium]|uniref:ABC transporter ATP-binding protein n=1 Tax=Cryptosporangium minutisporangium TaxID=113569 RepID=A0ABP6TBI2_9ACTN